MRAIGISNGSSGMFGAQERGTAVFAMKTLCAGAWPEGQPRSRQWWYKTVESQDEVDLAVRFSLSQPGVVAAIPPSFLDLLDKAIDAATLDLKPLESVDPQRVALALSLMTRPWLSSAPLNPCGSHWSAPAAFTCARRFHCCPAST